jgi:hypothetical protein
MTKVPFEKPRKKNPDANKNNRPRRDNQNYRIANAIALLKNAFIDQSKANRDQESGESRSETVLQSLTLFFVVLTTVGIFYQACILNDTDKATQIAARAADESAKAAISANNTTRSQISAYLIVPEAPQSKIKIDTDFTIDFYIANSGQTAARDVNIELITTIRLPRSPITPSLTIKGGPLEITPQSPWHRILSYPNFIGQSLLGIQGIISVSTNAKFTYINLNEPVSKSIDLVADTGDLLNRDCCTADQLKQFVPLVRPFSQSPARAN